MGAVATSRKSGNKAGAQAEIGTNAFIWTRVAWVALLAVWIFLAASLIGFNPADPPSTTVFPPNDPAQNWCGRFGAGVSHLLFELFGVGAWLLLILGAVGLITTAMGFAITHFGVRLLGGLMMAGALAGLQSLILPRSGPIPGLGGGLVGTLINDTLITRFNSLGTLLWLGLLASIGAIVALDVWALIAAIWTGRVALAGAKRSGHAAAQVARTARERAADHAARRRDRKVRWNDVDDDEEIPGKATTSKRRADKAEKAEKPAKASKRASKRAEIEELTEEEEAALDEAAIGVVDEDEPEDAWEEVEDDAEGEYEYEEEEEDEEAEPEDAVDEAGEDEEVEEDETPGAPQVFAPEDLREKINKLPVRFSAKDGRAATQEDLRDIQTMDLEGYEFPTLELLEEPELNYSDEMEVFVREQAEALERALKEYRIDGEVVGIDSGPVITLYEVRLAPGTKVAQVSAISSDLARALKAINIRIVANMAGRDTVGVEVPNAKKEKVRLKELMADKSRYAKMQLPMFLGKDAHGDPLIEDLAALPHALIAGTTGSGKSVCMNTIIMSFLYTRKPNELKLVLVDPKMVELSQFKDIPHLMCPVVTEMSKAAAILEWAVGKMEERYALLVEAGCRDIASYNALEWEDLRDAFDPQSEEEEARIPRKLPYMVFIIDELADLMMTNKEVEHSIVRLAQKARAVGIHLIVATQRPQANVVTGLIKSNLPARITFKVASGMDSRIVLDQKGGELLLGQGDMLYLSPRSHKLLRSQGTLVDDKEIRRVARFLRDIAAPSFERSLVQIKGPSEEDMRDGFKNAQEDPLFDKAVEIVLETKRGSVSMLQRRLAIGYTRSARLIEMMGEAGIIGSHKGTVAREVTLTLEEWHAMKAQAEADAAGATLEDEDGEQGELFPEPEDTTAVEIEDTDDEAPAGETIPFVPTNGVGVIDDEAVDEEAPELLVDETEAEEDEEAAPELLADESEEEDEDAEVEAEADEYEEEEEDEDAELEAEADEYEEEEEDEDAEIEAEADEYEEEEEDEDAEVEAEADEYEEEEEDEDAEAEAEEDGEVEYEYEYEEVEDEAPEEEDAEEGDEEYEYEYEVVDEAEEDGDEEEEEYELEDEADEEPVDESSASKKKSPVKIPKRLKGSASRSE